MSSGCAAGGSMTSANPSKRVDDEDRASIPNLELGAGQPKPDVGFVVAGPGGSLGVFEFAELVAQPVGHKDRSNPALIR